MSGILPVSNIINVTITNTPSGLTEKNVNSLALFTTETPDDGEPYSINIAPSTVIENYGTSSVTAAMANAIFAQSPNLRTGNGRLVVIPYTDAVSATSGYFTTASLTANLAALIAVTNGDLRVTIDSVNYDLTGVDFTPATTIAGIAEILQSKLVNGIVTSTSTTIIVTSKKVGADADVVLAALSGGSGTDLAGSGLLNTAGGTATSGANSSGETLLQAIARTKGSVSYAPIITNLEMEDSVVMAVSNAIQAMDNIFLHHVSSTVDISGGLGEDVQQAGNKKTRILGYTVSPAEANLMKSAYSGRGFSVNFTGSLTSQTMNLKQLATITPDPGITQTLYSDADINGVDLYVSYDGVASVYSTGGNDFFDNPYSDLALKFALETAGFNYLRQTNTKVPQTEPGMSGLKSAYAQVCDRFVRNGCIAPGAWTSSERFGNPVIFDQNVLNFGYYIYSLPIILQSASEREIRKAPLVQIAIKRAGAIHTSDVIVLVND
jgi:hypothetical protein